MPTAAASRVTVACDDAVGVITVNNPPVNALSHLVRSGLLAAITAPARDPQVRAIVITGGPERFIAGADLSELDRPPDEPYLPDVVSAIEAVAKPVVAAIDGPALGGGLEIALACDLRLGSPRASVGLTETRIGLIPGAGGTQRLPRLVAIERAILMIGEGRILPAKEAHAIGILDGIVERDLLEGAILQAPKVAKRRLSEMSVPDGVSERVEAAVAHVRGRAKGNPAIEEAAYSSDGSGSEPAPLLVELSKYGGTLAGWPSEMPP